jgi:multiple sugar transport system permease protein
MITLQRQRARDDRYAALWFLLPNALGFLVFTLLAILAALGLSFLEWDMLTPPKFVGTENFTRLLLKDKAFRQALVNTLYYTVGTVPFSVILGLAVAVALNRKDIKGRNWFRAAYFLPAVTSLVAVSLVWSFIFDANSGLFNGVLRMIGISDPPAWLSSTSWALPAVMIVAVWGSLGYNMVLFLAGLQGIPRALYEAADIDGAGAWQQFWHITVPMLSPTTFFVVVIAVINSFQVFGQVLVLTQGGPANATNTIVYYIYEQGFQFFQMGYASAAAWILFLIIFALTLLQMRLQRRWVNY